MVTPLSFNSYPLAALFLPPSRCPLAVLSLPALPSGCLLAAIAALSMPSRSPLACPLDALLLTSLSRLALSMLFQCCLVLFECYECVRMQSHLADNSLIGRVYVPVFNNSNAFYLYTAAALLDQRVCITQSSTHALLFFRLE
jgi:hypothetical protein